ncbi:MAG: hypothetical protein HQK91_10765 [Nitrospirae bacterium]|nr:hypothetical protein [Nitrospirota bacterium]MBF0541915.1 hypothetical protein [Nitrospirota bacterium]
MLRNEKTIKLSIGEVKVFELQVKQIRQMLRGEVAFYEDGMKVSGTVMLLGLINELKLTNLTEEQIKLLSKAELLEITRAFIEVNNKILKQNELKEVKSDGKDAAKEFDNWLCDLISAGHTDCPEYGFEFFLTAIKGLADRRKEYIDDVAYAVCKAFSPSSSASKPEAGEEGIFNNMVAGLKENGVLKGI